MIRVSFSDEYFVCKLPFEDRAIAQKAGFRFDAGKRIFYTPNPRVAARLREYADESAERKLKRTFLSVTPWPGRDLIHPESLTPFIFQKLAALFALARNRAYLALDPGLGKTIVAALILNALPAYAAVYVCPPFLGLNVFDELSRWTSREIVLYPDFGVTSNPVLIVPDSKLTRAQLQRIVCLYTESFGGRKPLLFIDEAHRFNHETSQRSSALFDKIAPRFDRQFFMSGTPMNRPIELYPVLSKVAPETIDFMKKFEYARKFCGAHETPFGWDFTGASNMKELAARVLVPYSAYEKSGEKVAKKAFMIRIKKSVLGRNPVREELVFIGDKLPPKTAKMEAEILKEFSPKDLMKLALSKEGEPLHVSTYRKELGLLKVKPALPVIRSILDDTEETIIIVAIHKDVISELAERLGKYRPFVIDGSVPQLKRVPIAKEFQRSKIRRPMILNPRAGGIGLNLQRADRVVFHELDWVDNVNRQAIDRADRIGRVGDVFAQYLVYRNSIDKSVVEENLRKRRVSQFV